MMLGGAGIGLGLRGKTSNAVTLFPGDSYIIPAGNYQVNLGPYTSLSAGSSFERMRPCFMPAATASS